MIYQIDKSSIIETIEALEEAVNVNTQQKIRSKFLNKTLQQNERLGDNHPTTKQNLKMMKKSVLNSANN